MPLADRLKLYRQIETVRKRPLVVYITSLRQNADGKMAGDFIPQLLDQLSRIPEDTTAIDLLVVSYGGDPSVAWRAMCLLRERFQQVGVLVPQSAFSAATLLCLGANEIVMHRYGNLGPVDPQVHVRRKSKQSSEPVEMKFGYEEVVSFIQFIREHAHITDQSALTTIVEKLLDDTGTVSVGAAVRGSMLSQSLGENLLRMHMTTEGEAGKAKEIAEMLNKKFYNHGHALGRTEARNIGLKVAACDSALEKLMWGVWEDVETELKMREAFSPMAELARSPSAAPLFTPITSVMLPQGLPPAMVPGILQQVAGQLQAAAHAVPAVDCDLVYAIVESRRLCSRFVIQRKLFGVRQHDGAINIQIAEIAQGWQPVDVPEVQEESPQLPDAVTEDISGLSGTGQSTSAIDGQANPPENRIGRRKRTVKHPPKTS